MNKLETVEDVLAWAYDVRQHEDERFAEDPPHAEDRATATEIARAMRLLRVFREMEALRCSGAPMQPGDEPWTARTLRLLRSALDDPKP